MAYGSISDIYLLGYIPREDIDALEVETPGRVAALFEAEADEWDMYIRPRNGVPLPSENIPPAIKRANVHRVVFELYIIRGFVSAPEGSEVAKQIIASNERALKLRDDIRDGRAQLNWTKDATPARQEAGISYAVSLTPNQFKFGNGCGC